MYELHRTGATLGQVGKRYGLSASRVSDLFKAAGLEVVRHRPDRPVADMHALYETGATLREVGAKFGGLSAGEVRHLFLREGLSVRSKRDAQALRQSLPESRRREICELYRGGASQREVAERVGVSVGRVRKVLEEAGALRTRERPVEEMHALYRSGASLDEVARHFELSVPTVQRRFADAGLHIRTPGESKALRAVLKDLPKVEAMRERYRAGATLAEVAREFGMSRQRVSRLFKTAGVPSRDSGA